MDDNRRQGQLNKAYKKTSDAGFSLIELLIAVTILAIIVIPLLHMFVTSTRINVKSRQTLRATTVAQDIMEGLKAYTLEEVSAQFAPPAGASSDVFHYPSEGFYVVNSSLIQGGVRDLTEDMAEYDGVYYFGIENLKMQGGEYDALIRLDAYRYGEDKDTVPSGYPGGASRYIPHDNEFNGKFYAEIGSVAEINGGGDEEAMRTDSSYHESKELADGVLKDIKEQIEDYISTTGGTLPSDWEDKELKDFVTERTILVEIADAGAKDAEGNEQCKATITFIYEYEYAGLSNECMETECPFKKGTPGHPNPHSHGHAGSAGGTVCNVSRTFSSGNFYLFYYPLYKPGAHSPVDNIQFQINDAAKLCDENEPLLRSITLAKQIRSDVDVDAGVIAPDLTDAELRTQESSYQAMIDISADTSMSGRLVFRTNADTNMVKNLATGKRDGIGGVIYAYDANTNGCVDKCDFSGDTTSDKVTNIIYDIEITVYKTGAAQHFTESNFEDNDDVHRLASITNMSQ